MFEICIKFADFLKFKNETALMESKVLYRLEKKMFTENEPVDRCSHGVPYFSLCCVNEMETFSLRLSPNKRKENSELAKMFGIPSSPISVPLEASSSRNPIIRILAPFFGRVCRVFRFVRFEITLCLCLKKVFIKAKILVFFV